MNDTKVYTCVCKSVKKTPAVTHADYRALEDENRSLRASFDEAHELWVNAAEELALLRVRVGELQDRIEAYQEKGLVQ